MRIFWLGGVAEKEEFKKMVKDGNTQIAANITQLNYIEGLEENNSEAITILNSHFEPSFPKYKKLIIRRKKWQRKGKENIDIGFINIPIFKYFNKIMKLRKELKKILKKEVSEDSKNVFFIYAMTAPLMLLAPYIKRHLKNTDNVICLIVPDLPEFMNVCKLGRLKQSLLKINRKIIYKCLKYIDKFVLFSEPMAKYLNLSSDKYVTIEGMVNKREVQEAVKSFNKKRDKYIMYAGGINEKYGVLNLVKAFHKIKNTNLELKLYGKGDAVEQIKEIAKIDERIKYYGVVTNDIITMAEKNAILLVNPRPTNEEYTKYSFPSKNMEYMASGTATLTTKLPGIPKEYYDYVYLFKDESVEGMKNAIEDILSKPEEELIEKGKKSQEFILKNKNNVIQCKKIIELINK